MYKLTLILFTFFSLVLPILAVPVPASDEINGKTVAFTGSGRVGVIHSLLVMILTLGLVGNLVYTWQQ